MFALAEKLRNIDCNAYKFVHIQNFKWCCINLKSLHTDMFLFILIGPGTKHFYSSLYLYFCDEKNSSLKILHNVNEQRDIVEYNFYHNKNLQNGYFDDKLVWITIEQLSYNKVSVIKINSMNAGRKI